MRTAFDFSPLYRSSIGFDRVFDLLENASRTPSVDNWPPYDIARIGEDAYRITMAVAGFAQDELSIVHQPHVSLLARNPLEQAAARISLAEDHIGKQPIERIAQRPSRLFGLP